MFGDRSFPIRAIRATTTHSAARGYWDWILGHNLLDDMYHPSEAEEAAVVVQVQKLVWDGALAAAILVEDRTDSIRTWWIMTTKDGETKNG